ncbi:MAG: putative thymidylate synthase [Candidatus Woesearchaeota archaeon]|nr:putative thymidylate synthase [Candidatus Woesearchaeota archaeon]
MNKIKIGKDNYLDKEIIKLVNFKPKQQLFNSNDVYVGHPSSNLAIGAIYTWKQDLAPKNITDFLQKLSNYAYMSGFWRTTNGTKYVFSNILANPNVNKLVILVFGQKDNGHLLVDALLNFWKNGVDRQGKIIGTNAQNPRFEQIPLKGLERIRKQCDLIVIKNIKDPSFGLIDKFIKNSINTPENPVFLHKYDLDVSFVSNMLNKNIIYDDGARFDQPFLVDLNKNTSKVKIEKHTVSNTLGASVQAKNLDDALYIISDYIFSNGSLNIDKRKTHTVECRSFTAVIEDALERIPAGFSKEYIESYVDEFLHGPKTEMSYNYHDRVFKRWGDQAQRAIEKLKQNPETRRTVICLWDPAKDMESCNPPCFNSIWVAVRDDKLEFHVVFRSHHLATVNSKGAVVKGEGAFVPNLYAIASLQKRMAKKLNISRGPLILTDMSGHLYVSGV